MAIRESTRHFGFDPLQKQRPVYVALFDTIYWENIPDDYFTVSEILTRNGITNKNWDCFNFNGNRKELKENKIMEKEITIVEAIDVLTKEIIQDEGYRYGWQANIAMAFKDEWERNMEKYGVKYCLANIHAIANKSAQDFLDVLCDDKLDTVWGENYVVNKAMQACCVGEEEKNCCTSQDDCCKKEVKYSEAKCCNPEGECCIELKDLVGKTVTHISHTFTTNCEETSEYSEGGKEYGDCNCSESEQICLHTDTGDVCIINFSKFGEE